MGPGLRRDGEGIFDHSNVDADFFTGSKAGSHRATGREFSSNGNTFSSSVKFVAPAK